jgi:hypothetical protein
MKLIKKHPFKTFKISLTQTEFLLVFAVMLSFLPNHKFGTLVTTHKNSFEQIKTGFNVEAVKFSGQPTASLASDVATSSLKVAFHLTLNGWQFSETVLRLHRTYLHRSRSKFS